MTEWTASEEGLWAIIRERTMERDAAIASTATIRGKALEEAADECRALRNSEYAFLSQDRQLALAFAERRIRSLIGTAPQKEEAAPSPQGSETKGAHKVLHGHAYAADDYNEPAICPKCKLLISTTQSARFVCRFRAECAGLAASVPTREGAE